jgi:hypothetical protein
MSEEIEEPNREGILKTLNKLIDNAKSDAAEIAMLQNLLVGAKFGVNQMQAEISELKAGLKLVLKENDEMQETFRQQLSKN